MKSQARRAFCLGLALVGLSSASAQDSGIAPEDDPYRPLNSDELLNMFNDATVRGCYNNRTEAFNEHTASNGRFYDNIQGGLDVGYWYITETNICYYYEIYDAVGSPGPHCFFVVPRGKYFDFMSSDTGTQIASTQCEDEPIV